MSCLGFMTLPIHTHITYPSIPVRLCSICLHSSICLSLHGVYLLVQANAAGFDKNTYFQIYPLLREQQTELIDYGDCSLNIFILIISWKSNNKNLEQSASVQNSGFSCPFLQTWLASKLLKLLFLTDTYMQT